MTGRIHALMQYAYNGDAVYRRAKVDDVLFNAQSAIPSADVATVLPFMRRLGQGGARGLQQVRVTQGLGQIPLRHGVVENFVQVALRSPAEPEFSPVVRICAA
jgi:hypothetical protein